MLNDPRFTYQHVANKFGVTRQYIAQLAEYPPAIQAVMDKLRRAGFQMAPYNSPQPSTPNRVRTSLKMILVNGVLCTIQVRPAFKFRPNRREYARLDVGRDVRRAKAALFAIRRSRTMKLYVIPLSAI